MKQAPFEQRHRPQWARLATLLDRLERRQADPHGNDDFVREYRRLCNHLALARQRGYSSHLVDDLQQLAQRGHQQLYRRRPITQGQVLDFMVFGFPRAVRQQWPFVLCAALVFFGSLGVSGTLVFHFPDLIYSLLDPEQVREVQSMYDPDQSRLGRASERLASEDWAMFGYYVMNNIGIAFQTFASGLLLGAGSLFYLLYNGLTIGAIAGHLTTIGYGQPFWTFIVGHSALELSAVVLAGAAGLRLGWALIAPGALGRGDALREAAGASVRLVYGIMLLLVLAAFVEAYWSSRTSLGPLLKYSVGGLAWALLLAYFGCAGRNHHAHD